MTPFSLILTKPLLKKSRTHKKFFSLPDREKDTKESAGWPVHLSSAQDMNMNMIHRLTSVLIGIDNQAVSLKILLLCNHRGFPHQISHQFLMLLFQTGQTWDLLFRYEQNMNRRLCLYILKGETPLILINNVGRNFLIDDFRENSGHGLFID